MHGAMLAGSQFNGGDKLEVQELVFHGLGVE